MEQLSIQLQDLKRRNSLYITALIYSCVIGLLFNGFQILKNEVNIVSIIAISVMCVLMFVFRKFNNENRWLDRIPFIGLYSMIFLSYVILFAGKRLSVLMILYVCIILVTIYMRRSFIVTAYAFGLPAHYYYLDKMGVYFHEKPLDVILYFVFFTIIFVILVNMERIMTFFIQDLKALQTQTDQLNVELEQSKVELEQWNGQLEVRVDERTKKVRLILDHVEQGFLTIGPDLKVEEEFSSACIELLGTNPAGKPIDELIAEYNPELSGWLEGLFKNLFAANEDFVFDMYVDLLPKELIFRKRVVSMTMKMIRGADRKAEHLIIVFNDITKQRALEVKLKEEEKMMRMVVTVVARSRDYWELVNDYKAFVEDEIQEMVASGKPEAVTNAMRIVHTFKGNFAQLNCFILATFLHYVEDTILRDPNETMEQWHERLLGYDWLGALEEQQQRIYEILPQSAWSVQKNAVPVEREMLVQLKEHVLQTFSGDVATELASQIEQLYSKPFYTLFETLVEMIPKLAERLEKMIDPVPVSGGNFPVDPERWHEWDKSLIHVVRNQLDHGIESPDGRLECGKEVNGKISISIVDDDTSIAVIFEDDGAGIDYEKLRRKLVEKQMISEEIAASLGPNELNNYLFIDQVSTKDSVSELSGRGVGLAKVLEETEKLGGKIEVMSTLGAGTKMSFVFPK